MNNQEKNYKKDECGKNDDNMDESDHVNAGVVNNSNDIINIPISSTYAGLFKLNESRLAINLKEGLLVFDFHYKYVGCFGKDKGREFLIDDTVSLSLESIIFFNIKIERSGYYYIVIRTNVLIEKLLEYYDHREPYDELKTFIVFEMTDNKTLNSIFDNVNNYDEKIKESLMNLKKLSDEDKTEVEKCLEGVDAQALTVRMTEIYQKLTNTKNVMKNTNVNVNVTAQSDDRIAFQYPMDKQNYANFAPVTIGDRKNLEPKEWLNDNLVNWMLLYYILKYNVIDRQKSYENLYFETEHNSFTYYTSLAWLSKMLVELEVLEKEGKSVNDSTVFVRNQHLNKLIKEKLFEVDIIILPIHAYSHWSLAIVMYPGHSAQIESSSDSYKSSCIVVLDSKDMHNLNNISLIIRTYLRHQYVVHANKNESDEQIMNRFSEKNFPVIAMQNIPKQKNSWDCGIYTLEYAATILKNGIELGHPVAGSSVPIPKLKSGNFFDYQDKDINNFRNQYIELYDATKIQYEGQEEAKEESKMDVEQNNPEKTVQNPEKSLNVEEMSDH